jgi:hypothetical protein
VGDELWLAFQTRFRLFKPSVMQFGKRSAPADFQWCSHNAIRESLDFASAYLDDELIYSYSVEEHFAQVWWIMLWLLQARLYLKPEKCEFHKETVSYLGLIISTKRISND